MKFKLEKKNQLHLISERKYRYEKHNRYIILFPPPQNFLEYLNFSIRNIS